MPPEAMAALTATSPMPSGRVRMNITSYPLALVTKAAGRSRGADEVTTLWALRHTCRNIRSAGGGSGA